MPPTGQYTEAGQPILFYVKAIYKYDAASAEEFSFQKDDVIGVYGEWTVTFDEVIETWTDASSLQKLTMMAGGRENCWTLTGLVVQVATSSQAISLPSWTRA